MVASELRLDGALAGLQGRLSGDARANADFYTAVSGQRARWYCAAQERVLFLEPPSSSRPVDRHLPPDEVRDAVRARREGERRRADRQRREGVATGSR